MRYETAAAFRSALEDRLKKRVVGSGQVGRLDYLRKQVVFERILARMVEIAHDRFILKGALGLEFRGTGRGRTTKDMDLGSAEEEEEVTETLLAAAALDLGDYFVFRIERVDTRESAAGRTVRYRVEAELAGTEFATVNLDVALNETPHWEPEHVETPGLLRFADLAPVSVPALSLEQQIAEKIHAYTRVYEGGRRSSRVKDFVDILSIATRHSVRADRLTEAIEVIFARRGTHDVPARLPEPPDGWSRSMTRLLEEASLAYESNTAFMKAAEFLQPVLSGEGTGIWNPEEGAWSGVKM